MSRMKTKELNELWHIIGFNMKNEMQSGKYPAISGLTQLEMGILLASGDNRHSGSGEKRQFWSTENSHLQFE